MKTKLTTLLLTLITSLALGHGAAKIGPNGGRLLEFSKSGTTLGEITVKDGKFDIAVLDKGMKSVALAGQSLTAMTGNRQNPQKLEVTKTNAGFSLPVVNPGEWLILQFKPSPDAKAITTRLEYDTSKCGACKKAEWLCACK